MSFILKSAGLALIYVVAAKVGLVFGTVAGNATVFWPPGGIALAAVLLGGLRFLPAVFVAAYLVAVTLDDPFIVCLGTALGNVLETYLGYTLIKRFGHVDLLLKRTRDLFAVILLGGLIPAIASATLGPLSLLAAGFISPDILPGIMIRWWRADLLGIAFFAPLILVFAQQRPYLVRPWETFALWVMAFILGQMVLLGWMPPGIGFDKPPGVAWVFPPLFWAALRTGRRNTGLIQLMFMAQSLASAYLHVGFFADDFVRYGMANFWMFAMLLAVACMAAAIMATAHNTAMRQIALNSKVFTVATDGIMIVDANNNIVAVNPAFTDITGYPPQEVIGRNPRLLSSGQHGPEFYAGMWNSLNKLGHWEGEVWNRRKDGVAYLERLAIHTVTDSLDGTFSRIAIFSDITQQKAAQETMMHQAQHDFLTNLPNRLLFCDRFNQQLAIAKRHARKFAVIYLDLDRFKPVNDTLGHRIGDQLLVAVAGRLKFMVREIDTVSRFGGDEFAILVSEVTAIQDVTTLADKILAALSQPFELESHVVSISASLGIAVYPDHGADMEALLHNADAAMYQAKQAGNNTFVIAGAGQ
jgi:diguanylate cyclase (GGDEF)-like protein/PAS domain S-box-containing protein